MNLNHSQKKAVSHFEGPCLVLAGPGSGKTLTIAKRIEYLINEKNVDPQEILVITFTKYAANEMRDRFRALLKDGNYPVTFGTFHGIYYGILKWAYHLGPENLLKDEERLQILGRILEREQIEGDLNKTERKEYVLELSEEIGKVKNEGVPVKDYQSKKRDPDVFKHIYEQYETDKRHYKKIDFEDMLLLCRNLFLQHGDILTAWQRKYKYILVDEFQDINQVQYDVIKMLAGPENNLFVVGDDDQSVYGFRGSKPQIMQDFMKDFPQAKRILLDVNYRSDGCIVKGALRVIGHNSLRFEKEIKPGQEAKKTIHIQGTKEPVEESMYILKQVQRLKEKGNSLSDIAILYRTTADARTMAQTFREYQVPFRMKEQGSHLYDHFICTDLEAYFRIVNGNFKKSDLLQVINRPNRYVSRDAMTEEEVSFESLRKFYAEKEWMQDRIDQMEWDMKMLKGKTPYAAISYIRKSIGYDEFIAEYASYRGLDKEELNDILTEIEDRAKHIRTMDAWLEHVVLSRKEFHESLRELPKDMDAVSFLTMHGAKGLEFPYVFVIEANEGQTPYKKAKTKEEIEEERRLFYVAMTRAEKELVITYVKEKNGKSKDPSRFVYELIGSKTPSKSKIKPKS